MRSNIFHILPQELIDQILGYINHVELIFSIGNVSHTWRNITHEIIWNQYRELISKLIPSTSTACCKQISDLDQFLYSSSDGRKFIKYLLRKQVYEFSSKLLKFGIANLEDLSINFKEEWIDEELRNLKQYFKRYSDVQCLSNDSTIETKVNEPIASSSTKSSKNILVNALSFIGSFFSKNPKSTNPTPTKPSSISNDNEKTKKEIFDFLIKVALEGETTSGKTSFKDCVIDDKTVLPNSNHYIPTLGTEFSNRSYNIGDLFRVRLQLWDQPSYVLYKGLSLAYYRGSKCILLLVDPFSKYAHDFLVHSLNCLKNGAPTAEIILITAKKDLNQEQRLLSNAQADKFAFENFGGSIHLDITNTQLEEPKTIVLYCVLMFLLSNV